MISFSCSIPFLWKAGIEYKKQMQKKDEEEIN
jgi:hypothetical protein